MYYRESESDLRHLPEAYGGVAFSEKEESDYIEPTKPNRNPWEEPPSVSAEVESDPPKPKEAEGVFGFLPSAFPMGEMLKKIGIPMLGKILPVFHGGKEKDGKCKDEENIMLLLVMAILFFSPRGDKKAAVLLLLVYLLA